MLLLILYSLAVEQAARSKMKRLAILLIFATAAAAANISGVWSGAFRAVGGDSDVPQLFILKQEGAKLTGTGGPDSSEQYPIINGSVTGDTVKFEVNSGLRRFFYELKTRDQELRGTLSIKSANDTVAAKVRLGRVH
jgi:hypothetical protein